MTFDIGLLFGSIPQLLAGLGLTLELLFLSSFIGLALAVITLLMRISGRWFLVAPAVAYIYVFRGTPILVQIFVIYYGLPQFEFIREGVLWPILREPFWCAVIALSLNAGAYVSEILRGGVLGVDKGILEAASALGISKTQRFIYITSPIAIRLSLPAYSNDIISMTKATALASTITLLDMTGVARTIVAQTFAPYEIFISAAIIYMVMAWIIQRGFGMLEKRMSRYLKPAVG
jgi:arginine/ornithine transport system permease protein